MSDQKYEPYAGIERDRDEAIRKFHNFAHDLPFLKQWESYNPSAIDVSNLHLSVNAIEKDLCNNDESLVLNTRLVEELSIDGELYDTGFSRIAARSGQNSRHGVFFGKLALGPTSVDIAIKSFPDAGNTLDVSAIEELVKTHAVKNSGVRTFEPVGIGRYADVTYTLWTLEPSTSTLDSIDWRLFSKNPASNPGMIEILGKTADELGAIHNRGWGHYDFHPKNVASDIAGNVFAIDWETAEISGDTSDPETRYARARADLVTLATAFYNPTGHAYKPGIELLTGLDLEFSLELFSMYFLKRYIHRRTFENGGTQTDDVSQLLREMKNLPDIIGL